MKIRRGEVVIVDFPSASAMQEIDACLKAALGISVRAGF